MFAAKRLLPMASVLKRHAFAKASGWKSFSAPMLYSHTPKFNFSDSSKNNDPASNVGASSEAVGDEKSAENEGEKKSAEGEGGAQEKTAEETKPSFEIPSFSFSQAMEFTKNSYSSLRENVALAYSELKGEGRDKILKKKVNQAASFRPAKKKSDDDENEDEEEAPKERGPSALVHVKEPVGAWEAMKNRLQDSPLIREILKGSRKVGKAAVATPVGKQAQDAVRGVQDKLHDAREFWETSQNPLVYTLSGVWDNLAGETEEGMATAAIKKLDPDFDKEEWAEVVKESLAPTIIGAHLRGDPKTLKPLCGEAVYNKLAADIRARKADGLSFDTNILDIDENQIILKLLDDRAPIIVVVYMVQQINCIRNRKGEIVEGGENEIRAKFYSIAYQQTYDEDDEVVSWKVVDYEFAGDIPYY